MCAKSPISANVLLLGARMLVMGVLVSGTLGCRQDMHDQLKVEPLERSTFFPDGQGSRHPVTGTIARGQLKADAHLHEGRHTLADTGGEPAAGEPAAEGAPEPSAPVETFPFEVTLDVLHRGRERYNIFCSPCHAETGKGDGMVVRRGYRQPPALYSKAVRDRSVGHLYDVIRRGIGVMPGYASQIPVRDRWAIVAYLRALQLSQSATLDDVPAGERPALERARTVPPGEAPAGETP